LIYRHLFVSRLANAPDVERAVATLDESGTLVLNPPTPHLEMKSTLALLSEAVDSPSMAQAIGLGDDELATIRDAVPWTRSLMASRPGGDELVARIAGAPDEFVVKRSWSYGGNEVFVGRARDSDDFWRRVHATYPGVHRWEELCVAAANDARGGGFVVQRAVRGTRSWQWLCSPTTAQLAEVTTDYAAYASLGADPDWSGVCRAASSDVVNIVGGGAVVPILTRQVADQVLARLPESNATQ
jgi:hypothetical protein